MDEITARARRRTGRVLAVGALTVIVVALLVAAMVIAVSGGPKAAAPRPGAASAPIVLASPAGAATSAPIVPAGDLRWVTVAGASVPVSRSAGPHDLAAGRASGFARTALGAVMAAVHISVRLCPQVGPAVFGATVRDQVVGANTAALARQLDDAYQQARAQLAIAYGQPAGQLYATVLGYRLETVSADTATVRLLLQGPGAAAGSVLVALVVHLQWSDTDWALVAPPGGDFDADTSVITDSTGYTRFPDGG